MQAKKISFHNFTLNTVNKTVNGKKVKTKRLRCKTGISTTEKTKSPARPPLIPRRRTIKKAEAITTLRRRITDFLKSRKNHFRPFSYS